MLTWRHSSIGSIITNNIQVTDSLFRSEKEGSLGEVEAGIASHTEDLHDISQESKLE